MAPPPKLLDQVRDKLRVKHDSIRTGQSYVDWIKRYILFHGKLHKIDWRAILMCSVFLLSLCLPKPFHHLQRDDEQDGGGQGGDEVIGVQWPEAEQFASR